MQTVEKRKRKTYKQTKIKVERDIQKKIVDVGVQSWTKLVRLVEWETHQLKMKKKSFW